MSAKLIRKLKSVRKASLYLGHAETLKKNAVLNHVAQSLRSHEKQNEILIANKKDIKALPKETSSAFIDRLALNKERIELMAESLTQVAQLEDPLKGVESRKLENGLILNRIPAPLGVILMIFESRPNVAIEAFGLAFKAGNGIILRGGRESMGTTKVIYKIIAESLSQNGFSPETVWGITDPDRKISSFLLKQKEFIDVVVPRGGPGLIKFVVENSPIPIIKNDRGLCHVYVHEDADLDMALKIIFNAKTQRPSACNSMETVLVNKMIAGDFINSLYKVMLEKNVEWHGDTKTLKILGKKSKVKLAKKNDWNTEYLDQIMNCRVVDSFDEAIKHIEEHGSRHSESIITKSEPLARRFQSEVDAAVVYWNASTRFTDGFEFGLGGELGISTQKLHVRGPVGLKELTSFRWVVDGTGQVRK